MYEQGAVSAPSLTKECRRHDSDSIWTAVGLGACGDDDRVEQVGSHLLAQPLEVGSVLVTGDGVEFDPGKPELNSSSV